MLFGCQVAAADKEASSPPNEEAVNAVPMRDLRAPKGLDFSTVTSEMITISAAQTIATGKLVHLRVALDPEMTRSIFHGRVQPGRDLELMLSRPKVDTTLYFQLFDENGSVRSWEVSR